MSGNKLLLDTNIALYLIQGDPTIIDVLNGNSLKLPDSIICGTSLYYDIPLISADKVLKKVESLEFIFYEK